VLRDPACFRAAGPADAEALRDLEREANVLALAHVFGAEPFPDASVLARWREELADPSLRVDVVDGPGRLDCYVAHDAHVLLHLAVHPEAWGRGLAREAVERAASRMERPTLWVLDLNERAKGLYRHLGWEPTGRSKPGHWPPYPTMSEWTRPAPLA
jgi:GNAT superfamily N-acetyltransferase